MLVPPMNLRWHPAVPPGSLPSHAALDTTARTIQRWPSDPAMPAGAPLTMAGHTICRAYARSTRNICRSAGAALAAPGDTIRRRFGRLVSSKTCQDWTHHPPVSTAPVQLKQHMSIALLFAPPAQVHLLHRHRVAE